jgi:amino acid transporter
LRKGLFGEGLRLRDAAPIFDWAGGAAIHSFSTGAQQMTTAQAGSFHRTMSFRDLVMNGLVFIGPAAAVAVFGPLDAKSHGATAMVYVVATVVMGFTAVSYAQMSRAVPKAGSVFSYATAGIGPGTGFIAGWMVLLDYVFIPSVAYLFTGLAMHSFVPSVPTWAWTAAAVMVTTTLNLTGVKNIARAALVVALAEIVVLAAVLVGIVVVVVGSGTQRPLLSPLTAVGGFSLSAVIAAVSIAVLSYLGFDAIATFAEENAGEARLVGRATLVCLVMAGILFVAQSYLVALVSPVSPEHLAANPELQGTAYYDIVRESVAPWLATALGVAKALGASFSGMVALAAGGRVALTMSREGRLPRAMSGITRRTGIPTVSTVTVTAVTLVLAVWAAQAPDGLGLLVSIVNIGALSAFVLLHISVIGFFIIRGQSRRYVTHLLLPVLGVATLIPVMVLANHRAQLIGSIWLLIGLISVAVHSRRRT